ncbi:acyltransferase family protein [Pseudomonas shirazica]|uniref:acyltransferase family protein n=1 Tax=Pseudomonas shirazica TaxID=1940636 RepID=UPI001EE14A5D|nr:acyltransferase [Pseudomonas shirazica]
MGSKEKLTYLDGMRGLAAIVVVLSHCIYWFAPYLHSGTRYSPHPAPLEIVIVNSPFTFMYRGGSAVWLFFVLSGFVLSFGLLKRREDLNAFRVVAVKRYFRLNIPVFFAVILGYIAMVLGAYKAQQFGVVNPFSLIYTKATPDFWQAFKQALFGSIVYGDTTYNYVLWTISIELYGSFLVFSLIALFGGDYKILRMVCILVFLFALQTQDRTLNSMSLFAAGILLATFKQDQCKGRAGIISAVALVAVGLYLMGFYPSSASYSVFTRFAVYMRTEFGSTANWSRLYAQVGVILLLYSILLTSSVLRPLGSPFFAWLGKISYSVYLLHSIILAIVAPYVFLNFSGIQAAGITFVVVLPLTLFFSHWFYVLIDNYFTHKVNKYFAASSHSCPALRTAT